MYVALVQNNPIFGEKERNIDELLKLMESVEADLFILPELAYTGYQFVSQEEAKALSDSLSSPSLKRFEAFAKEKDAAVVVGFAENAYEALYNSLLLITPEGDNHLYRKTHLFYKEKEFFKPGNTGFNVFSYRGVNIGLAICFDWIFPESFRTLALKGADIIAHSSNLVMPYCQQADYARAIENRVFIATANRVGTESRDEESFTFTGESVLLSPKGEYLMRFAQDCAEISVVEINPEVARNKQINPLNNLFKERRTEYYR